MPSKYWIKLYHEALHDPKMGRLSDHLYRRCIELFLMAGELDDSGALPEVADMAWTLRTDQAAMVTDLQGLAESGILTRDGEGWVVTHFAERQEPDDASERGRRFRERQHAQQYKSERSEDANAAQTQSERGANDTFVDEKRLEEIEKQKRGDESAVAEAAAAAPRADPEVEAVAQAWEAVTGKPNTPADCHTLTRWLDEYPRDAILRAIEQAHLHQASKLAYVYRVLADGGSPRASPGPPTHAPSRAETLRERNLAVIDAMLGGANGNGRDHSEDAAIVDGQLAKPRDRTGNRPALPGGPG